MAEMSGPVVALTAFAGAGEGASVQLQLRSTRSHVRGHYRRNYHVASTLDAFQLRGIGEARRDERRPFHRAKNRARGRVCYLSSWIPS